MESTMIATTYTKKFFETDFDIYKDQYNNIKITNDLRTTEIPAVPIELNQDLLREIYNQACINDKDFQPIATGSLFNSWHSQPRSSGWFELTIKEYEQHHEFSLEHDPSQSFERPRSNVTKNVKLLETASQLFDELDIKVRSIRIMKLEPGGWVRPHIDRTSNVYGLAYAWIPLHEFSPCLKIFPYGWLQHRFGNMYLFNQNSYVHAVINQSNENRYVIAGRFDPDYMSSILIDRYHDFKHDFLSVWKSNN